MTRSTVTPINSGSMPAKVCDSPSQEKSPVQPWLGALARRWGLGPSYTRQQVFADFGVFERSADAVEEMLKDGRGELVAMRCARLDAVRAAFIGSTTTTEEHRVCLHKNFESDAAENPATAAHAMELSPVSWLTARRRLIKEVHDKLELIRSGDLLYRSGGQ